MSVLEWVYVCASVCVCVYMYVIYAVMPVCVVAKGWQVSFPNKFPYFYIFKFLIFCVGAVCLHAWCLVPVEDKEGIGFSGTVAAFGYELSCRIEPGLWKHSQCSEPSLQPLYLLFFEAGFLIEFRVHLIQWLDDQRTSGIHLLPPLQPF